MMTSLADRPRPSNLFHLPPRQIQSRLLSISALFLILFSVALTLSPAVRERNWQADLRWGHWLGLAIWGLIFGLANRRISQCWPEADPVLLPLASLLSGWGLLTIWRLNPNLGLRQTLWLALCGTLFLLGLRLSPELRFLRRYKYLWLSGGLLLTALTLFLGVHPAGSGPRLWLGCCGMYLQPSEPLKLLLVVYLAAYFSERLPLSLNPLPLLAPTILLTGLALLLLALQQDLGTASVFILLYSLILFLASGQKRLLILSLVGLLFAGLLGYLLSDIVRLRVDSWLHPWADPSGHSYQIVQSLMAVANGGLFGRGPGLGNPGLVPVAASDFIFSAIAEETGLIGGLGLIALFGLLLARGMQVAFQASERFHRLLAAGLTIYLTLQSFIIIGGNLRLLPLTGITLPFLSYGGSSLLTSFISLLFLLLISARSDSEPAPLPSPQPYLLVSALLVTGLMALALTNGWWALWRGPDLLTRTDNPRRAIADRYVRRGSLLDRNGDPLVETWGEAGGYQRRYLYPPLGPVVGYTHPVYGQAGLEAALDGYLRGLQGNAASLIWWNHLLYGQPPPGLDVRLSLDLDLQRRADLLLGGHHGAVVLLHAQSGEVLAMASHPFYDPNLLGEMGTSLLADPISPLVNRATQGQYPVEAVLPLFLGASGLEARSKESDQLYRKLGFYTPPSLPLPVAEISDSQDALRLSPLQMALAVSALSQGGVRPAPRLVLAVNTPEQGWVVLPPSDEETRVFSEEEVRAVTAPLMTAGLPFWEWSGRSTQSDQIVSWYLGGTPTDWQGTPLALVVLLEEDHPLIVQYIGRTLLEMVIQP